jgi:catechol 2,3-dioxygenase-like lactoylglutathione lyase family enzyme
MTATLTLAPPQPVRFHLSLNVSDLGRSVAFYRTLFGMEPAKLRSDYAKFEVADPPLVMSLEPTPRGAGGALNHLGFRMPDAAALVAMQRRLEEAGVRSQREEGVECCYARQTKFWVHDPDGTLWEVYTLEEDIEHRGAGQSPEKVRPPEPAVVAQPAAWEHRMNQPVPERAPNADGSVDEVRLRGTFNLPLGDGEAARLLAEARRVLRPGGRLFVHVLTAERPFAGDPGLPGPASAVKHVPVDADVIGLVEAAGFEGVRLLKFDASPCFVREGVPMRETQLEAYRRPAAGGGEAVTVVYKGPFRELSDDLGNVYPRGRRVTVSGPAADRLRSPEWAGQFTVVG